MTVSLGLFAFRNQHIPVARTFAWVMAAMSFWTFCYGMELITPSLNGKIFWASAKYIGSAPGPVLWFILSLQLTKKEHWLNSPLKWVLGGFVLLTCLVVFTNPFHHGYWKEVFLMEGFPETQSVQGFYFWVYAAGCYLLILTSVVLYFRYYRAMSPFFRRQAFWMALGGFIPLAGRIPEDFFGLDLIPKVDNIILLFLVSGIIFAIAIFWFGSLRILPIAHSLVIKHINAGIIVLDVLDRVVEINPFACNLLGIPQSQAVSKPVKEVLASWPEFAIQAFSEEEIVVQQEGQEVFYFLQVSEIKESDQTAAGHSLVWFDITQRKKAEIELERLARTDPLTGVYNRRYFFELAESEFQRAKRYNRSLTAMMLDLDYFKQINDNYGHQIGDQVLKFIAKECQSHLRQSDIFARYGGEEFVFLLPETEVEKAFVIAERIRKMIHERWNDTTEYGFPITLSIGLASFRNQNGMNLDMLIHHADKALYESKAQGRNQVTIWGRL